MRINKYFLLVMLSALSFTIMSCSDDDEGQQIAPTPDATGSWTDERDQSVYEWVRYGDLEWTTTNLRYIPSAGATRPDLTPVNPRYYDDGIAAKYYENFGLLYNHEAALAAIPEGWRLPTVADWADLEARTNGDLKGGIKLSLGGYSRNDVYFTQIHPNVDYYAYVYGFYWTADIDKSKTENNFAYYRKIVFNEGGSTLDSMDKSNFLNVRLVRNAR